MTPNGDLPPDDDVLRPTLAAWRIIEEALVELGISGPDPESRAEHGAKAITARLVSHDPSILLVFDRHLARPGPGLPGRFIVKTLTGGKGAWAGLSWEEAIRVIEDLLPLCKVVVEAM